MTTKAQVTKTKKDCISWKLKSFVHQSTLLWPEYLCPIKIRMLKSKPQRWWHEETGPLSGDWGIRAESSRNEITALIKGTLEGARSPSTTWGHSEQTAIYKPGSRRWPWTKSSSTLILDSLASRAMGNRCLLFINYTVYSILLSWPE